MNFDIYANQVAFIACACLGGIAHYLKKVAKGETTATFKEWFGGQNLPATLYTLLVFFFIIIGSLAGDIINEQTGFWAALYTGFATGFAVDAGFNADGKTLTRDLRDIKRSTGSLMGRTDGQYNGGYYDDSRGSSWDGYQRNQGGSAFPGGGGFIEGGDHGQAPAVPGKVKVVIKRRS